MANRPRFSIASLLCLVLAAALLFGAIRTPGGGAYAAMMIAPTALLILGLIGPALGHHHGRRYARWLAAQDRRRRRRLGLAGLAETPADRLGRTARAVGRGLLVCLLWWAVGVVLLLACGWLLAVAATQVDRS